MRLELPDHVWWARVTVAGGYGYLFADNADLARWQSWLRAVASGDLAEYKDLAAASIARRRLPTTVSIHVCSLVRHETLEIGMSSRACSLRTR